MRHLILIFCGILALAGCRGLGEHAETTVERSWPAADIKQLAVKSVHSEIRVVAGKSDRITMRAEVSIDGPEAKLLLAKGPLAFNIENGVLTVSEQTWSKKRKVLPWIASFSQHVDYYFEIPDSMKLAVTNVSGEININGTQAEADVRSVNGNIEYTSFGAPLTARTVNGAIEARFTHKFNGAKLRTVNGPVDVEVPGASNFVCNVSQVNGGFESNIPVTLNHRRKSAAQGQGGSELEVTTVNGDITLMRSLPAIPPVPPVQPVPEMAPMPAAPAAPAAPAVPVARIDL